MIDLDELQKLAEAATPGEIYSESLIARKFQAKFRPAVALELIERVWQAESALVELDDEFTRYQEEFGND